MKTNIWEKMVLCGIILILGSILIAGMCMIASSFDIAEAAAENIGMAMPAVFLSGITLIGITAKKL